MFELYVVGTLVGLLLLAGVAFAGQVLIFQEWWYFMPADEHCSRRSFLWGMGKQVGQDQNPYKQQG